jgi:hypothetical protein
MRNIFIYLLLLTTVLFCPPDVNASAYQDKPTVTAELTATPPSGSPQILSPRPGEALQGNVPVIISTAVEGLQSVELSFGYFQDSTQTWFPLYRGEQAFENQALLEWDTGQISDGDYTLRMVITLVDGSQQTVLVPGLRVRNYTPIETETPQPSLPTATPLPQATPTPTRTTLPTWTSPPPTPTPLLTNPAELTSQDVYVSAGKGVLAVVCLFTFGLLYNSIRSRFRRK